MTRTSLLLLLFFAPVLVLLGCSKPSLAPAKISGSLTYKGQPIRGGTMAFHTAEGAAYPAQIGDDGTYSATDIPEGELIVTVSTAHLDPARKVAAEGRDHEKRMKMMSKAVQPGPSGGAEKNEPFIKIPEKYGNPKTSPITVTTTSGRNVKDIDLTD